MHGQKRSDYKSRLINPETSSKLATKARQWNKLSNELSIQRQRLFILPTDGIDTVCGDISSEQTSACKTPALSPLILLSISEKMLSVNPDPSHLWNIRREMLFNYLTWSSSVEKTTNQPPIKTDREHDPQRPPFDIEVELSLTSKCLQRNPKAYAVWYHRKWSLVYFVMHPGFRGALSSTTAKEDEELAPTDSTFQMHHHLKQAKNLLQTELRLCSQFLQMDERNFHCWNYRRFVVGLMGSCIRKIDFDRLDEKAILQMDVFDGSWSSWVVQHGVFGASNASKGSRVHIGAQLCSDSIAARGIFPTDRKHDPKDYVISNVSDKRNSQIANKDLKELIINEWDFTTLKIQENFSNGSAFHFRSKLLPLLLQTKLLSLNESVDSSIKYKEKWNAVLALAREEWENIILNAIFTEPDDQTPWWYHRFIVSWCRPVSRNDEEGVWFGSGAEEDYQDFLLDMADSLRELLEVEKECDVGDADLMGDIKGAKCKWTYLGLHLVLSSLFKYKSDLGLLGDHDDNSDLLQEASACLKELIEIDPNRRERYQNLLEDLSQNRLPH